MNSNITKISNNEYLVYTDIVINAPAEKVWAVLTDFENMPSWSSTFQGVEGDMAEGAEITSIYKGLFGKEMRIDHPLVTYIEGEEFSWSSEVAMGIVDNHIFRVEKIDENTTKFVQTDQPHGGATRVLGAAVSKMFKSMYETFNEELKERVESLA